MNEITFNDSPNVFLRSGIIALHQYLKRFKENNRDFDFEFELEANRLSIQSINLFGLLEELYFAMGREIYDTSGKKALEKAEKYYFVEDPFQYKEFYKMKTYGLAALVTNDPAPFSRNKKDSTKFKNIFNENRKFALNIASVYKKKGIKLKYFDLSGKEVIQDESQKTGDSKIYLNRPYTKTTRLDFGEDYFKSGENICYLTGEGYKKLVDTQNTSPFISGIANFNSFFKNDAKKISWKAMYLSRFAPNLCLYSYIGNYDDLDLVCYLFNSNNLCNLENLYLENLSFYKDKNELAGCSYRTNFSLYDFSIKKGSAFETKSSNDFVDQSGILFMLIFTLYRKFLFNQGIKDIQSIEKDFDPLADTSFKNTPINLVTFKAGSFSNTMRPNSFENFNNFKYVIRLLTFLERNGVNFKLFLRSLKFPKKSDNNSKKKYQLKRKVRNTVLGKVLFNKTVAKDFESLFYNCYKYYLSRYEVGYKNFKSMVRFLILYEPLTNYGGNKTMNKTLQRKAIKLGSSIGMSILNFENAHKAKAKKSNAKAGRRYIIGLQKSRNLQQFNEAIIRIQNKYALIVSKELLNGLNEENYSYVKQFAIIGALNQINTVLNSNLKNEEDHEDET